MRASASVGIFCFENANGVVFAKAVFVFEYGGTAAPVVVAFGSLTLSFDSFSTGKCIITRAVLRLVWPSILLQSARDHVATPQKL